MGRFDGEVVWITGGGTGLGRALALELGRQGATVAVSGRRADRLAEVVEALGEIGAKGLAVPCDVTQEESVQQAVASVVAQAGRLTIAIANAGFGVAGRIATLSDADWRRQFDTNVFGLLHTVRAALPELEKHQGRVVLLGSVAAFVAAPKNGAYNASKAAVRAIGDTLSAELAGTGVTCTTLHPGFVATEIGRVDNQGVYHPDKRDKRPGRLMWTAEAAAKAMVGPIAARKREHVFTGHGKVGVALSRLAPGLTHWLVAKAR
ncbi:MAG: SDR family NAD(P)-dependent oxidoreductase [Alphaproteobacteria bacterium]|nr:SDR family NAD(P)-dependent oxidoreductase [Alphaproteobacteria bacterium]